ncbi:unnamed protein product [Ilex paraguariensis]|uniref:BHLH domain-containing protein n=1 Tax=Ilex paraguariensis TaxID=185542 RepID=A0ABC8QZP1_9AQUA
MPLSEFYRMGKSKLESTQQKTTSSTDLSFVPDNEFCELVWENGQIMIQSQSDRTRKSPIFNNFPSHTPRLRDKVVLNATTSKTGKFAPMESISNDIPMLVPSNEMGFSQDDDMVPWLNYPVHDILQQDYCSELLPEISGVTGNEPSTQSSFALIDKRTGCNQTVRGSQNLNAHKGPSLEQGNTSKFSSQRTPQLYPWLSQEGQKLVLSPGSGVSDIICNNNASTSQQTVCEDSFLGQASTGGFPMKMQKQDSGLPRSCSSLLNFSHFSRPAAVVRANLENVAASGSSGIEMTGNKRSASGGGSPSKSVHIDPRSSLQKEMGFRSQPNSVLAKVDSKTVAAKPPEESHPVEQSDGICREDAIKNDKSANEVLGASLTKRVPDGDKTDEPVVASSSVCSGSSADRASNDLANTHKRKCRDTDESECQSGDIEEESVGGKKAATAQGGTGSKRGRASEVHNLSERRRRDRINEKMRALQELIPNCNKVDKASMLDEAIEYLKTLQLQVQIMSMGAGLYMPPMMLPVGMQHIPTAHIPHYAPMGIGMGMGIGFGMGMVDIHGGSPGCPMIPVPHMQGAPVLSPPVSGPTSFQGIARSNFQVFGHPGQGLPMSVHPASLVPLPERPPINAAMGLNAVRMAVKVPNVASTMNAKDLMQNANPQAVHNVDASSSMHQLSSQKCQFQAKNGGFDQPSLQENDQAPDVSGSAAVNLANAIVPSKTAGCK